jgi:hypothetical protein
MKKPKPYAALSQGIIKLLLICSPWAWHFKRTNLWDLDYMLGRILEI